MKKTSILKAIALASLPMANSAMGQNEEPAPTLYTGSVSTFNLALTLSTSYNATIVKDENGKPLKPTELGASTEWTVTKGEGDKATSTTTFESVSKIQAAKYTTKELLFDLVRQGVIPGTAAEPTAADIKGWSIVKVQATVPAETEIGLKAGPVKFYAVKKDTAPVELRKIITLEGGTRVAAASVKTVSKSVGEAEPVVTKTEVGSQKQAIGFYLDLGVDEYALGGIYADTSKLGATKSKLPTVLFGAGKITSLAGTLGEEAVVEGSASFGAGAAAEDVVDTYGANVLIADEAIIDEPVIIVE